MITNADITIFHKIFNKQTHTESWEKREIKNVYCCEKRKINAGQTRMKNANRLIVRIPYSSADNLSIKVEDYIYKGITNVTDPKKIKPIFKVKEARNNKTGSRRMHHLYMEAE